MLINLFRGPDIDELQEFRPRAGILPERARHSAGHHRYATLVYASGRHAFMDCIHNDTDTARLEHVIDAVGDLGCQLLLNLESPGIALDDPCELADTHHLVGRQIADV